jgi:antitoxin VapB
MAVGIPTSQEVAIMRTKAFKNGNSQAVHIPAELAYASLDIDLEIERIGDEIRIRPKPRKLDQLLNKFAQFSPDFMAEGRPEEHDAGREAL